MARGLTFVLLLGAFSVFAQESKPEEKSGKQIVEASCGQCNFGMKSGGCSLAVKIDGKPYLVDGFRLSSFGDEHGAHGMCHTIRKAEVEGEIVNNRFKATSFTLLPVESKKNKKVKKE